MNVVEPDVGHVLPADDEQAVGGHAGQVGVPRAGHQGRCVWRDRRVGFRSCGAPFASAEVEHPNVVQHAELLRIGSDVAHPTEDDEEVVVRVCGVEVARSGDVVVRTRLELFPNEGLQVEYVEVRDHPPQRYESAALCVQRSW